MTQVGGQPGEEKGLESLRIPEGARGNTPKKGNRRTLWFGAGAAVILLAIIVAAALLWRPPLVRTAVAVAGPAGGGAVLNASGYVTARRKATVAAKITGRVEAVMVEEGTSVSKDQVLARLDDSEARARYRAARARLAVASAGVPDLEASLAQAERDFKRDQALLEKGFISEREVDRAGTAVKNYRARLAEAKRTVEEAGAGVTVASRDLENCVVRAPFAGIVVSKDAQPGEMVSPISAGSGFTRTGIATIVDMTSLEIEVDVNEAYIARVRPGQPVEAALDAYPDWRIPASVLTVIPTADRQKATVAVRIVFKALDPKILPDMGVKVRFLEDDGTPSGSAAVTVPPEAIRTEGNISTVYVVQGTILERRAVRLGPKTPEGILVEAGLNGGERVVMGGPEDLRDGERVRVAREGER